MSETALASTGQPALASTSQVAAPTRARTAGTPLRVAFLGAQVWLDGCAPTAPSHGLDAALFPLDGGGEDARALAGAHAFRPQATVIFDPAAHPPELLRELPGTTLGVLVDGLPDGAGARGAAGLDRLIAFDPALTGERVGDNEVWRATPPSVNDALYGEVRPLHRAPRAMTVGRSTPHREALLMPTKHSQDLLQVIHGVSGAPLIELLREYDVAVYASPEPGGRFGPQVGMHLAAGQLLLSEPLTPAHGLERNIDYLHYETAGALVWAIERMERFPEMYQRIRIRGRLKAEQYRASRLFARLAHDLLADVAAFG
jgi:hypothetical protein